MKIKELKKKDINSDFFKTLRNLSKSLDEDIVKAKQVWTKIRNNPNHKILIALSDDGKVIGLATLLIEKKFIRNFGKLGHLEDVVVRKGYEKKELEIHWSKQQPRQPKN